MKTNKGFELIKERQKKETPQEFEKSSQKKQIEMIEQLYNVKLKEMEQHYIKRINNHSKELDDYYERLKKGNRLSLLAGLIIGSCFTILVYSINKYFNL